MMASHRQDAAWRRPTNKLLAISNSTANNSNAPDYQTPLLSRTVGVVDHQPGKKKKTFKSILVKITLAVLLVLMIVVAVITASRQGLAVLRSSKTSRMEGVTFIEMLLDCTNDSDGMLSPYMYLASGNCIPLNLNKSMNNGCQSGIFDIYNSPNCTGPVAYSVPRNACTSKRPSGRMVNLRCSTYNDEEYLRMVDYFPEDARNLRGRILIDRILSSMNCTGSGRVAFIRFGSCAGFFGGRTSTKYEKVNGNTTRLLWYGNVDCSNTYRAKEETNGICRSHLQYDIVSANTLNTQLVSPPASLDANHQIRVLMHYQYYSQSPCMYFNDERTIVPP